MGCFPWPESHPVVAGKWGNALPRNRADAGQENRGVLAVFGQFVACATGRMQGCDRSWLAEGSATGRVAEGDRSGQVL